MSTSTYQGNIFIPTDLPYEEARDQALAKVKEEIGHSRGSYELKDSTIYFVNKIGLDKNRTSILRRNFFKNGVSGFIEFKKEENGLNLFYCVVYSNIDVLMTGIFLIIVFLSSAVFAFFGFPPILSHHSFSTHLEKNSGFIPVLIILAIVIIFYFKIGLKKSKAAKEEDMRDYLSGLFSTGSG